MHSAVLKSKISTSIQVAKLSDHAALLFTWALSHTDDYGRMRACPHWWTLTVAPGRTTVAKARKAVAEIVSVGLLIPYSCCGEEYLYVPNWFKHQGFNDTYSLKALYPNPTTCAVEPTTKWPEFRKAYPTEEARMSYNGTTTVVQREYRTEDNTPSPSSSPSSSSSHTPAAFAASSTCASEMCERDMGAVSDEGQGEPSMFTEFMTLYPKKADRAEALREWWRVCRSPQVAGRAIVGLKKQIEAGQFDCEHRFIPLASSYIRKRRFEDDVVPPFSNEKQHKTTFDPWMVKYGQDHGLTDKQMTEMDWAPVIKELRRR